jgi:hypothetical protein
MDADSALAAEAAGWDADDADFHDGRGFLRWQPKRQDGTRMTRIFMMDVDSALVAKAAGWDADDEDFYNGRGFTRLQS